MDFISKMLEMLDVNCRCTLVERVTPAEEVLHNLQRLKDIPGIVIAPSSVNEVTFARIKLAQKLLKHPALALRAQVEEWSWERIVRKLY